MRGMTITAILLFLIMLLAGSANADMLSIENLEIETDDDEIYSGSGDGHIFIEPGKELEFKATIENDWDRDDEEAQEIEDIILTATLKDLDDGDDITYSSSRFDLRPEGYKKIRWDFDIEEDVDSDRNYELEVQVRGYEENGEKQEDRIVVEADVERDMHKLVFEKVEISDPSPCSDMAKLRIEIRNEGENDEEAELRVESHRGTLYEKEFEIEAYGDDDEYELTRTLDVSDFSEGIYILDVVLEYDNKEITETVSMRMPECGEKDYKDNDVGYTERGRVRRDELSPTTYDVRDSDIEFSRSRNTDYFRVADAPEKVEVKFDEKAYVPPISEFEDLDKKDGSADWEFYGLVTGFLVLLIITIVLLVLMGISVFEL